MPSNLILIDHPVSSYSQKVRIALREKRIPFIIQPPPSLATAQPDPAFAKVNPRLEVPLLYDGDIAIFDSTIILHYLEEKWPDQVPLLPRSPAARAEARIIEDICDTHYEAINWGLGEVVWMGRAEGALEEHLKNAAARQIKEIFSWLEEHLQYKDYFGGDCFGWTDIAVVPFFYRSSYFGIRPMDETALAKWFARVKEIPSVRETIAEFDNAVSTMTEVAPAFISGKKLREYRDHRLEWMVKSGGIDIITKGMLNKNIRFSWPHSSNDLPDANK